MSDDEGDRPFLPGQELENQPFDEAYNVDDPEEIESNLAVSPQPPRRSQAKPMDRGNTPPHSPSDHDHSEYDDVQDAPKQATGRPKPLEKPLSSTLTSSGGAAVVAAAASASATLTKQSSAKARAAAAAGGSDGGSENDSASESMESSSEETSRIEPKMQGAYNPKDYENLPVSAEIKELFAYITRFSPQIQELDTKLKPFIPDYIPAVGDIDAFIKIPRPDGKPTGLGLDQLDEPCAAQSDPTVLDLQLRAISKMNVSRALTVKTLENAEDNPKAIDAWISSITELHRQKPPQSVHYSHPMPDIESLLQEWPTEFEELLKTVELPSGDLEVPLKDYADIVCGLLDIPVFRSRIQSLHLLFSLYGEMRNLKQLQSQPAPAAAAAETLKL